MTTTPSPPGTRTRFRPRVTTVQPDDIDHRLIWEVAARGTRCPGYQELVIALCHLVADADNDGDQYALADRVRDLNHLIYRAHIVDLGV
jgi:hypothetical protein